MAEREFKILITGDAAGIKSASREGGQAMDDYARQGTEAHQQVEQAAEKSGLKHKELHELVKGLKLEFPELAHLAHFALNPITLAVAAITSAFAIWNYRMKELATTFGNLELPDITPTKIGHVNAAAEAWKHYGEEIAKAAAAYNSVDAAADRHAKKMTAETERQKKLLEANKGLELAKLEGDRGSMSEGDYESKRLQIENRYAAAGLKIDESSERNALNEKARRGANLQIDAELKAAAAGRIKVGSAEDDAQTEEDLKRRAEVAKKDIEIHKKRIDKLNAYQSGEMGPLDRSLYSAQYTAAYGLLSPEDARAEETQKIGFAQTEVDRYNDFLRNRRGRDEQRARRSELYGESAKEMSEAGQIHSDLPGDLASTNANIGTNRETARISALTRTVQAATQTANATKQLQDEMTKSQEAGHGVLIALIQRERQNTAVLRQLQQQVSSLEGTRKLYPPAR